MNPLTDQQANKALQEGRVKLIKVHDTQKDLDSIPATPGYVTGPEILCLLRVAEMAQEDWTLGLRCMPGDKTVRSDTHVRAFPVWTGQPGNKRQELIHVRVRHHPNLLSHAGNRDGLWLPAFDAVQAEILAGRLMRWAGREAKELLDR